MLALDRDDIRVRRATWAEYERILERKGERSGPRISYLDGWVEIMSPGRNHEGIAEMIGRLVEAWCDAKGIEFAPLGSWTIKKQKMKRGAESDGCYILDRDDPGSVRRPDLAIEVIWTHGGLDKLEIWRKLGVPEVWVWEDRTLTIHTKRGDRFITSERSQALPGLDVKELASYVMKPGMPSKSIRAYRAALARRRRRRHR